MGLVEKIEADYLAAYKAHETERVSVLRMVRSALKNHAVNTRTQPTDADALALIQREIKQHHESKDAFEKAQRPDEVVRLQAEIDLLETYLPEQLSNHALRELVAETIAQLDASSMADAGKVIGALMPKIQGRATGGTVSVLVKEILSQ